MRLRSTPAAGLERWFAAQGAPARYDLARSGACPLSTEQVLALGGEDARDELIALPLEYGDPAGSLRLRAAIVASGAARHVDEVLVTTGAAEALLLVAAAILAPGDRIRVATPAYEGLTRAAAATGADVEGLRVWSSPSDVLDATALFGPGSHRAIVVNSPHNPTGLVWPSPVLEGLARHCAAHGAWLIVDEVARATLDIDTASVSSLTGFDTGRVIAIGDVSKAFGLGGLRIGWLTTADRELIQRAAALKDLTSLGPAAPSEFLASVVLEHRRMVARMVARTASQNLQHLRSWIARGGGAWCPEPADGLVAFPLLGGEVDDPALAARLRADYDVGVVPGSFFDCPGHVRVGLGQEPDLFVTGLEALTTALHSANPLGAAASSRLRIAFACALQSTATVGA